MPCLSRLRLICPALLFALIACLLMPPMVASAADELAADKPAKTVAKAAAKDDDEKESKPEEKDSEENDSEEKDKAKSEEKESDDKPEAKDEEKSEKADAEDDDDDDKADKKASKKDDKKEEKKRKTFTVKPKRLKVQVTVDGTFVAREATEIILKPESWSKFEIEEIIEHGATVKEGDQLIKFDDEDLNEAIDNLELDQRLSELSLRKAEEELPRLEKTLDMALTNAKRQSEYTDVDYKEYKEKGRENIIESSKMMLEQYNNYLDNARDELEQLEKMYDEDDLTEETEEIVLKRSRKQVKQLEKQIAMIQYRHEQLVSVSIPRYDISSRESLDKVEMSLARVELAHKLDLTKARYELERMRQRREKSLEKHADLTADRGLMTVKAPASGLLYYGRCTNGKWGDMSSMIAKLVPEKAAPAKQVLMTIVDPESMYVYGTISEKNLPSLAKGQLAKVQPAAEDSDAIKAKVAMVSAAPVSTGKFAVEIDLGDAKLPKWLTPGMTSKVNVTTYDKADALLVPKKAVHTEEDDEDESYVWLVEEDEDDEDEVEVTKQRVKLGKTKGDNVEIVKGLDKGDIISLDDEKEEDDDDDSDD